MKPILHVGDTTATKYIHTAAQGAGARATLTDAPFVAEVTGKAGDRNLEQFTKSDAAKDHALLKESLTKTRAVVVNMKGVKKDALKGSPLMRVIRSAHRANVPIMLENASAEVMSELLGFGVGAEAIIIEPSGDKNDCHITCVGEHLGGSATFDKKAREKLTAAKPYARPITDPKIAALLKKKLDAAAGNQKTKKAPAGNPTAHQLKAAPPACDPRKVAARFQQIVNTRPHVARRQRDKKLGLLGENNGDKIGGYLTLSQHKFGPFQTGVEWDYKEDEIAVDASFKWTLARDNSTDSKYLNIKPEPVLFNPDPLSYNADLQRGAFLEKLVMTIGNSPEAGYPPPPSLSLNKHEPHNVNNAQSYCDSTGFSVSDSGISFSGSSSVTRTIQDFSITDNSSGSKAQWIIKLSMTDGGTNPDGIYRANLFNPGLNALPALATNTFEVAADSVFRVDASFAGQLYFVMALDLTVNCYWMGGFGEYPELKNLPQTGHFEQWMRVNFGSFGLMW